MAALVHSTLLLAVFLVGTLAADSPLDPVDVGQIVENLGSYFSGLANDALRVESAQVSPVARHERTAPQSGGAQQLSATLYTQTERLACQWLWRKTCCVLI